MSVEVTVEIRTVDVRRATGFAVGEVFGVEFESELWFGFESSFVSVLSMVFVFVV